MQNREKLETEADLFQHVIGCALLLVVLAGIYHNIFLSAGDAISGRLPSTHPVTALGFAVLAFVIFFVEQWERADRIRNAVSLAFISVSSLRVLEQLLPDSIMIFSSGPITETLEAIGMYGRYSVETAVFLAFAFGFEIFRRNHPLTRMVMVAGCFAVMSVSAVEMVFSLFVWGNELSFLTQLAMFLVSADLVYRMRGEAPFDSLFLSTRSSVVFQGLAIAVYVLPIIFGVFLLQNWQLEQSDEVPLEVAFAGASWCLLCLTLLACAFYSRTLEGTDGDHSDGYRETSYRRRNS